MDFVDVDESNARWVQDFRLRSYASPAKLESIDGARYHALLIPSCPGALADLASSGSLARILQHFHSESKPICAVGHGVAALCCATSEDGSWEFQGYSVTGPASQTQCTWCWTATLSPARTPAPLCQLCKTCFSSVAAGNEVDCTKQPALLAQMSTEEVGLLHRLLLGLLRPHLRAESSRGL
ncbi:glutamine amidotransferase-like class 1 domain-containing protein 1 isoform X6 [Loxodonta africana]